MAARLSADPISYPLLTLILKEKHPKQKKRWGVFIWFSSDKGLLDVTGQGRCLVGNLNYHEWCAQSRWYKAVFVAGRQLLNDRYLAVRLR